MTTTRPSGSSPFPSDRPGEGRASSAANGSRGRRPGSERAAPAGTRAAELGRLHRSFPGAVEREHRTRLGRAAPSPCRAARGRRTGLARPRDARGPYRPARCRPMPIRRSAPGPPIGPRHPGRSRPARCRARSVGSADPGRRLPDARSRSARRSTSPAGPGSSPSRHPGNRRRRRTAFEAGPASGRCPLVDSTLAAHRPAGGGPARAVDRGDLVRRLAIAAVPLRRPFGRARDRSDGARLDATSLTEPVFTGDELPSWLAEPSSFPPSPIPPSRPAPGRRSPFGLLDRAPGSGRSKPARRSGSTATRPFDSLRRLRDRGRARGGSAPRHRVGAPRADDSPARRTAANLRAPGRGRGRVREAAAVQAGTARRRPLGAHRDPAPSQPRSLPPDSRAGRAPWVRRANPLSTGPSRPCVSTGA